MGFSGSFSGAGGGGDLGALVSADPYASQAALESAFAAASNADGTALVQAGGYDSVTAPEAARLFFSDGTDWRPAAPRVWQAASSGSTGRAALYTAAGEALWGDSGDGTGDGDYGMLADGTMLYAVQDTSGGDVFWVPATMQVTGGDARLGVTHYASWTRGSLDSDPADHPDIDLTQGTVDYDATVAGKIAVRGTSDTAALIRWLPPSTVDPPIVVVGAYAIDQTQLTADRNTLEWRYSNGVNLDRVILDTDSDLGGASATNYHWRTSGGDQDTGIDSATEQDLIAYYGGGDLILHIDWNTPATGDAYLTADDTESSPTLLTTSAEGCVVIAEDDATTPGHIQADAFFFVMIRAIT